jgi:hypothetical protein
LLRGKAEVIDVFVGKIRQIAKAGLRIIEGQRIQGGDLDASDASRLHLLEFFLDFRLRDGWTKPPPAHHDPAVIRRMRERLSQVREIGVNLCLARWNLQARNKKQNGTRDIPDQTPSWRFGSNALSTPRLRIFLIF